MKRSICVVHAALALEKFFGKIHSAFPVPLPAMTKVTLAP